MERELGGSVRWRRSRGRLLMTLFLYKTLIARPVCAVLQWLLILVGVFVALVIAAEILRQSLGE
jgi:hypothetical protein